MAKKKDPGKDIAERNAAEMDRGQVDIKKDGKLQWVDPENLSSKQQEEVKTQSNTPPVSSLPQSVQSGITDNAPAAVTPPESAYQQLADAQANQYLAMTKALDPLTSGASLPATASQNASQMLGASATSPVSQWLNQQTAAAQAQNAPAAAAQKGVAGAEDNASALIAGGLKNMGAAENSMMQAAPYQQLLQSLAADVPYKLLGGESLAQILPTVSTAEQSLGLSTKGNPTVGPMQQPGGGLLPAPTLPTPAASAPVYAPPPESTAAPQS